MRKWAAKYLRTNTFLNSELNLRRSFFRPVVELLEDRVTPSTFLVVNTNDTGPGSFRQAIIDANANPGADSIQFNIPGFGVQTISPTSALPTLSDTVTVDGRSEGIFQGTPGYSGPPLIELNGTNAGFHANGLVITSSNCSVNGLVVNNFQHVTGDTGIWITGVGATGNKIVGNYIGTNADGTASLPNGIGVLIDAGASGNTIGGTNPGDANVISGNIPSQITIKDAGTTNNLVEGNLIGTNADGTVPIFMLFSSTGGISIGSGASDNTVGGVFSGARNVISGNQIGVDLGESGNVVEGNYVGTNATGTAPIPNQIGVNIEGSANTIGGTISGAGNLISGNLFGLIIQNSSATGNVVQGNLIGADASGTIALGNGTGITIQGSGSDNLIGGTTAQTRNVISGNGSGMVIAPNDTGNVIQGNFIGTDVSGRIALGNVDGIDLQASGNIVGGTQPGAGNVISGNSRTGVSIDGQPSAISGNLIEGNFIGTDVTGTLRLGNGGDGVAIGNISGNTIGGSLPGAGNVIAFNNGKGVNVLDAASVGDAILSNTIFSNAHLGIDLGGDGVTLNTPGGPHTGPNNLQNYPVLRPYVAAGTLVGTLNSTPSTTFRLEFFANPTWDPSGHGQGRDFLGSLMVTTDAQGNASFTFNFTPIAGEPIITATATDPAGNTSEFSEGVDFAPDDITARANESGQIWTNLSTGSSFTTSMWTTWSTGTTWVDVLSGDFNGDGRTDIAARDANTGKWWVGLSNGSGFSMSVWTTWSTGVTWADVQVGDFNGDGKADIVGRYAEAGQWWVALSNGSAFTSSLWDTWSAAATWVDVKVGDFNGDGKADITGRYLQGGTWWTGLSTGSSFTTSIWATWSTSVKWVDVQVGDFDGDGKADITGRALETGDWWTGLSMGSNFNTSKWTTWSTSVNWVDVKVGDFNGDGIMDIVGRARETGDWWAGISNASAFTSSKWDTWSTGVTWVDVQVGDFNGDGKSDITGRALETGDWWTAISTGSAFTTTKWAT
jgi:hypothetical protein